jgi:hypothetical protein
MKEGVEDLMRRSWELKKVERREEERPGGRVVGALPGFPRGAPPSREAWCPEDIVDDVSAAAVGDAPSASGSRGAAVAAAADAPAASGSGGAAAAALANAPAASGRRRPVKQA